MADGVSIRDNSASTCQLANFISEPVLIGFKAGIGTVIVIDQIPKIIGVHIPRGTFAHNVLNTIRSISEANPATSE